MIPPDEVTEGWYWARYIDEDRKVLPGFEAIEVTMGIAGLEVFADRTRYDLSDFVFHSRIPMPDEMPDEGKLDEARVDELKREIAKAESRATKKVLGRLQLIVEGLQHDLQYYEQYIAALGTSQTKGAADETR